MKTKKQEVTEERILTIKKVSFVGKWVEFWFKEEIGTDTQEKGEYQLCSKSYKLWDAVDEAGIQNEIYNKGFRGKKLKWKNIVYSWEIVGFV